MSADLDFYRIRERTERERAIGAENPIARAIHAELAERYAEIVANLTGSTAEPPVRPTGVPD